MSIITGSFVLCNIKLSFEDKFNPYTIKGTVLSTFKIGDNEWCRVDWGNGCLGHYLLNKGELIPFSEDILKARKKDAKENKSKNLSQPSEQEIID